MALTDRQKLRTLVSAVDGYIRDHFHDLTDDQVGALREFTSTGNAHIQAPMSLDEIERNNIQPAVIVADNLADRTPRPPPTYLRGLGEPVPVLGGPNYPNDPNYPNSNYPNGPGFSGQRGSGGRGPAGTGPSLDANTTSGMPGSMFINSPMDPANVEQPYRQTGNMAGVPANSGNPPNPPNPGVPTNPGNSPNPIVNPGNPVIDPVTGRKAVL